MRNLLLAALLVLAVAVMAMAVHQEQPQLDMSLRRLPCWARYGCYSSISSSVHQPSIKLETDLSQIDFATKTPEEDRIPTFLDRLLKSTVEQEKDQDQGTTLAGSVQLN